MRLMILCSFQLSLKLHWGSLSMKIVAALTLRVRHSMRREENRKCWKFITRYDLYDLKKKTSTTHIKFSTHLSPCCGARTFQMSFSLLNLKLSSARQNLRFQEEKEIERTSIESERHQKRCQLDETLWVSGPSQRQRWWNENWWIFIATKQTHLNNMTPHSEWKTSREIWTTSLLFFFSLPSSSQQCFLWQQVLTSSISNRLPPSIESSIFNRYFSLWISAGMYYRRRVSHVAQNHSFETKIIVYFFSMMFLIVIAISRLYLPFLRTNSIRFQNRI